MSNWLDEALEIDVAKYVKEGRKILKMQKVIYAFNEEHLINLAVFLEKLDLLHKHGESLKWWREAVSTGKYGEYKKFIEQAPDIIKNRLMKISYVS